MHFNNDYTEHADRSGGSSDPMIYVFTPPTAIKSNIC